MAATPIPFATKDNAEGRLNAGINASQTSIVLQSGHGANFPQPYSGAATSSGSSTTLNSTGILAAVGGSSSAMAGKFIWNKTDGSVAVIVSVATNALTCTRLVGGTDNAWDSGDVWCIDAFVVTFATLSTSAYGVVSITTSEQALVTGRNADTLTVATSGRGYNGTVANTFSTGDYVYLFVTSPIVEKLRDVISVLASQANTNVNDIATASAEIDGIQSNATFYYAASGSSSNYTITTSGLPAAYATGERVYVKANHTNTGTSTINRDGLGAKTIKKLDGATNLAAGDFPSGLIGEFVYDGTNYIMVSPIGQVPSLDVDVLNSNTSDSSAAGTSTSSEANFDRNYSVPSSAWAAGTALRVTAVVRAVATNSDTFIVRLKLGNTTLLTSPTYTNQVAGVRSTTVIVQAYIVCLTTGASGTLTYFGWFINSTSNNSTDFLTAGQAEELFGDDLNPGGTSTTNTTQTTTFDLTASQTLQLSVDYGGSSANNAARLQRLIVEKLAAN